MTPTPDVPDGPDVPEGAAAPGGIGRLVLLVVVVLAVPIVPFLILGEAFEARIEARLGETLAPGAVASAVIGLLAADIFLPVPSSAVSALAGHVLGLAGGTAASWCGMTLGATVAFGLARALGRPLARRLSSEEDLQRMDVLAARFGVLVIVLARPVPVFAEASVLLMGTTRLAWWRFLAAAGLSNLGISAAYAALGDRASLPVALAASLALPLVAAAVARWCWPHGKEGSK